MLNQPTSAGTRQRFPFPADQVFAGLKSVLPAAGYEVKSADALIGRIVASAGMSAFSWGEDISISVEPEGEEAAVVTLQSGLKVGINTAAAHRNTQNAERIIGALSRYLQSPDKDALKAAAEAPQLGSPAGLWMIVIVFVIIIFMTMVAAQP
jgi:hypothetical protein